MSMLHRAQRLGFVAFLLILALPLPAVSTSEEELFRQAEGLYRAGSLLPALDSCREFLERYPLSDLVPDVQYRRATILFRMERYADALQVFRQIERSHRSLRDFEAVAFWMGLCHYHLKQYPDAVISLERFLQAPRDHEQEAQAWMVRALAELALKNPQSARESLQNLLERQPGSTFAGPGLILLLGIDHEEQRYQEILARTGSGEPAGLDPAQKARFRFYRAEAFWHLEKRDEAVLLFRGLRGADTEDEVASVAFRRLFTVAQEGGDLAGMESLVQEAESRFASDPRLLVELWVRAGSESFRRDSLDLALFFLLKAWSSPLRSAGGAATPLYLAEIHLKQGRIDEARKVLEEYLASEARERHAALLRLGDIELEQGRFVEAEKRYGQAFSEAQPGSPRSFEAGALQAYSIYRQGKLEAASVLTDRLLKQGPGEPHRQSLLRLQAVLYRRSGKTGEAAAVLAAYTSAYPQDLKGHLDYLRLLFSLGRHAQALQEAGQVLHLNGPAPGRDPAASLLASYLQGLSRVALKDYSGALKALEGVTAPAAASAGFNEILPYAQYYRGWSQYRLGRFREARDQMRLFLEEHSGNPLWEQALYLTAWCSYSLKEYREAANLFAGLAKKEGDLAARALFLQAKSLLNLGEVEEASRIFRIHFTTRPEAPFAADALFEYAGAMARLGKTGEAADSFQRLAERYPASPLREEALYKRAEVYLSAKENLKARDAFLDYRRSYPSGRMIDASLYWGGIAAFNVGEPFGAVLLWESLITRFTESPFRADAMRRTAEIYAQRGDLRRALNLLADLAEEYPQEARTSGVGQRMEQLRLMITGLGEREASLAVTIGREGGAQTARGREAMLELARIYIYEGGKRQDLALEMLAQVVQKDDPKTASQGRYLLGDACFRKGEPVRAAEEYLKAATLNPSDADLMAASIYKAAEMMSLAKRPRDVEELLKRLEQNFPGSEWTMAARKLKEQAR